MPPVPPSTTQILAEKALDMECGQACVDWAAGLLETGCDSLNVAMLAAMTPPLNHFEVASRRDRVLADLGITDVSESEAVRAWAAEYLQHAWEGGANREGLSPTLEHVVRGDFHAGGGDHPEPCSPTSGQRDETIRRTRRAEIGQHVAAATTAFLGERNVVGASSRGRRR